MATLLRYDACVPTENLESQLHALLAGAPPEYLVVYLFGSQARGEARPDSDVDLAFWRDSASAPTLEEQPYGYAAQLGQALGKEVDLIELNRASPDLVHRVLRDGKLLLERDRSARIRYETAARRTYLDMAPVRARYRKARKSA